MTATNKAAYEAAKRAYDPRLAKCEQCGGKAHEPGGSGGITLCRVCFEYAAANPRVRPRLGTNDDGLPSPALTTPARGKPRRRGSYNR